MANRTNHPGRKSDKEWRNAIRIAVHELHAADGEGKAKKTKALTLMARKLVSKAIKGDVMAMKEAGDRLDGRPRQEVELDMTRTISVIERRIIDPADDAADEPKPNGTEPAVRDGPLVQPVKLCDRRS